MGASSGMGHEVAIRLLQDGWTVGVAARHTGPLEELAHRYGSQIFIAKIDVTQEDADKRLQNLFDELGSVDLYFHASGMGKVNDKLLQDIELQTVNTNAMGFTRALDTAYNWMAHHGGGHIAVISSIAGVRGLGPAPSYSATKAFQHNYIQALEQQANNRKLGIHFTEIRPGFVDTPFLSGSRFPMTMPPGLVVDEMMWAIAAKRHTRIIDWKYRILVALWRMVPSFIWRNMKLIKM